MENDTSIAVILLFVLLALLAIIVLKESARLLIKFFRGEKNGSEDIEMQDSQGMSE